MGINRDKYLRGKEVRLHPFLAFHKTSARLTSRPKREVFRVHDVLAFVFNLGCTTFNDVKTRLVFSSELLSHHVAMATEEEDLLSSDHQRH